MRAWLIAIAAALAATTAHAAAPKLPALGADPARVSVSGLSSGAFAAAQYAVAFSASTTGVGVVAGGPYDCAQATLGGATACTGGAPSGAAAWSAAQAMAKAGRIDPTAGLKAQRVYLYHGTSDPIVAAAAVAAVRDFYRLAGTPAAGVTAETQVPSGHGFVSADFGAACGVTAAPYVIRCRKAGRPYDQPGAILAAVLGPLKPRAATLSARPVAFSQGEFDKGLTGFAASGYVYVPAACRAPGARCAVHVVFHGCGQSARLVKDAVYGRLGFNAWAEANGIVVLYPQVDPSVVPVNLDGCWDWWGATGPDYATRTGLQLAAVHAMIQRLTSTP